MSQRMCSDEPTATYCGAISASRIGPAFPPLENTDVAERVREMELRNTPSLKFAQVMHTRIYKSCGERGMAKWQVRIHWQP